MKPISDQPHRRIEQLDGVRALAIGLVLAVHVGLFSSGWVGVLIFFVLSGFLITGILRRTRSDYAFWAPFYIRRATRILPPLVLTIIGATLCFHIGWNLIAYYVFFLANVGETLHRGESGPLGVLWSLAIEEHFYLLWPFAVRYLQRQHLIQLAVFILIGEPILRGFATPLFHSFWPIYFLTPFQLDGLAIGSLLSLLIEDDKIAACIGKWSGRSTLACLAAGGLLCLQPNFARSANSVLFNSIGYSLIVLTAASFIAYLLLVPDKLLLKLFANRWMVFIGVVSYGIYLFHPLTLYVFEASAQRLGFKHLRVFAPPAILLSILLSWLSFKFYEKPIIEYGRSRARAGSISTSRKVSEVES